MPKSKNRASFYLSGVDEIRKIYDDLPNEVQSKVAADTLKGIIQPVTKSIKAFIGPHKRSGLLKKSIKGKVKVYKNRQKRTIVIALVGPDRDTIGEYRGKRAWPNKYAHLVDRGTKQHGQPKNKSEHSGARAVRYMEKGYSAVKGYLFGVAANKAKASMEKVLSKLKRK